MNYLNSVKSIYMHMYMYISVSIYLCSGTIPEKKYKIEFRIHCPWYHECDLVLLLMCSLITHWLHRTHVRGPFMLHFIEQGDLMSKEHAHYFLNSFLILCFYWGCRLKYFSKCKDKKGNYSTLTENLLSSIQCSRCYMKVGNIFFPREIKHLWKETKGKYAWKKIHKTL